MRPVFVTPLPFVRVPYQSMVFTFGETEKIVGLPTDRLTESLSTIKDTNMNINQTTIMVREILNSPGIQTPQNPEQHGAFFIKQLSSVMGSSPWDYPRESVVGLITDLVMKSSLFNVIPNALELTHRQNYLDDLPPYIYDMSGSITTELPSLRNMEAKDSARTTPMRDESSQQMRGIERDPITGYFRDNKNLAPPSLTELCQEEPRQTRCYILTNALYALREIANVDNNDNALKIGITGGVPAQIRKRLSYEYEYNLGLIGSGNPERVTNYNFGEIDGKVRVYLDNNRTSGRLGNLVKKLVLDILQVLVDEHLQNKMSAYTNELIAKWSRLDWNVATKAQIKRILLTTMNPPSSQSGISDDAPYAETYYSQKKPKKYSEQGRYKERRDETLRHTHPDDRAHEEARFGENELNELRERNNPGMIEKFKAQQQETNTMMERLRPKNYQQQQQGLFDHIGNLIFGNIIGNNE